MRADGLRVRGVEARHLGLDLRQAFLGHEIGMLRDQTVWKILDLVAVPFFYKCSAHATLYMKSGMES